MSIEFHCHTLFSIDGSGTPEALVEAAAARGVVALAITEHNHLGIRYFPGVGRKWGQIYFLRLDEEGYFDGRLNHDDTGYRLPQADTGRNHRTVP